MVATEEELVARLREVLCTADLTTMTAAGVRRQLEDHFGVDLSDKKRFIRENIDLYLSSLPREGDEEEEEAGGEEPEEEGTAEIEEEEEEEEEDDEEEDVAPGSKRTRKKGSSKLKDVKRRRGGGFTKLCSLSPQLQDFVKETELGRTEVVKRIWAYIRENNLQDPSNRKTIICDEKLQGLFNVKSIDMFQMNKALTKHIWPLESKNADAPKVKEKRKQPKEESDDEEEDERVQKEKHQKKGNSGFTAPLRLSDSLAKFIGISENEMLPRSEVVKRIWDYIKKNNLQDPSDRRQIICDEKLKDLLGVDRFNGFSVTKHLVTHMSKPEK